MRLTIKTGTDCVPPNKCVARTIHGVVKEKKSFYADPGFSR
jgi:hypothetical protein